MLSNYFFLNIFSIKTSILSNLINKINEISVIIANISEKNNFSIHMYQVINIIINDILDNIKNNL
ncbi:hypothetical protein HOG21_07745 [bacterium]|nr:hypothetical protein [bacterium]